EIFFFEVFQKLLETEIRQSRSATKNEHFYLLPVLGRRHPLKFNAQNLAIYGAILNGEKRTKTF
ncbi:MAG: hypothetical protein MJY82_10590, partial [Fibrobacter sp.]|nr:hypothetical protein [Fibrobacter sp.]